MQFSDFEMESFAHTSQHVDIIVKIVLFLLSAVSSADTVGWGKLYDVQEIAHES